MRDGLSFWQKLLCLINVNVYPLIVVRCFREIVDHFLRDDEPVANCKRLTNVVLQRLEMNNEWLARRGRQGCCFLFWGNRLLLFPCSYFHHCLSDYLSIEQVLQGLRRFCERIDFVDALLDPSFIDP